jgi:hypothetical protein
MNKKHGLVVLLSAWAATAAGAPQLSLLSDLGVRGAYRHCEYSNGKVYGMDANRSCPPSIVEPAPDGKGMGYFKSESHEGSNKLCVYRVSGQDRTIRVDTHAQCPLNQEF